jgi:hypothetical protein
MIDLSKIFNGRKMLFLILLCNIAFSTHLFSQDNYERRMSISEWVEEMQQHKDKKYYVLRNTEIYFDHKKDTLYSYDQPKTEPTAKNDGKAIDIYPIVALQNCKIVGDITAQLRNIIFHKNISFSGCKGASQLYIYNCTFKQGLDFMNSDLNWLHFMYSSILQRSFIYDSQVSKLSYSECAFQTDYKAVESYYDLGIEQENNIYQYLIIFAQSNKKITSLEFSNCKVLPSEVTPIIGFEGGKYDVVSYYNFDFSNSIVFFNGCSVKEDLTVRDCKISKPIGMAKFNFPKDNTSFNWNQIDSVGIGIYHSFENPPLTYKTDTLISDIDLYNELNSSYRKFYSMYRTQGDIESANACYMQLKDMETTKYKQLNQQNPNLQTWFNWRFNQFLKYFSKYETNPVHSLIFSMWTILIFAGIYFFFHSDWDGINRTFLIAKHRQIMQYFSSEQRLEDFYNQNYMDDLKSFATYKEEMKESKAEIPAFIVLLGRPLYLLSVIKHKIATFIYRRTEILQGRWIDLKPERKIFVGCTVFFSVIIYLVILAFIRALNATTLSVNTFSTLGFGTIPVRGASRYITILEGFLGWFLLSIFSVSLISQMIQN